jgi:hypothetical protein
MQLSLRDPVQPTILEILTNLLVDIMKMFTKDLEALGAVSTRALHNQIKTQLSSRMPLFYIVQVDNLLSIRRNTAYLCLAEQHGGAPRPHPYSVYSQISDLRSDPEAR